MRKKTKKSFLDKIMLVFKHVEMQCDCNPSEYDEDEANKITYVVS